MALWEPLTRFLLSNLRAVAKPAKLSHSHEDEGNIITTAPGSSDGPVEYDELHVPCPPHTTERKLMAKVDMRLLPFLIVLYLVAFLDRINIANARSFHLQEDLHLTGVDYNVVLTIFFVPYCLFEIPSNILLKRFSPRIWLSLCGMLMPPYPLSKHSS